MSAPPLGEQVSAASLVPGAAIPSGALSGVLFALFRTVGSDPTRPVLGFSIQAKLPVESDYVPPAGSKPPLSRFVVTFRLAIDVPGTPLATVTKVLHRDRRRLGAAFNSSRTLAASIDCTGARVVSRVTEDQTTKISIEAAGPRTLVLNGQSYALLALPRRAFDFHTPSQERPRAAEPPNPPPPADPAPRRRSVDPAALRRSIDTAAAAALRPLSSHAPRLQFAASDSALLPRSKRPSVSEASNANQPPLKRQRVVAPPALPALPVLSSLPAELPSSQFSSDPVPAGPRPPARASTPPRAASPAAKTTIVLCGESAISRAPAPFNATTPARNSLPTPSDKEAASSHPETINTSSFDRIRGSPVVSSQPTPPGAQLAVRTPLKVSMSTGNLIDRRAAQAAAERESRDWALNNVRQRMEQERLDDDERRRAELAKAQKRRAMRSDDEAPEPPQARSPVARDSPGEEPAPGAPTLQDRRKQAEQQARAKLGAQAKADLAATEHARQLKLHSAAQLSAPFTANLKRDMSVNVMGIIVLVHPPKPTRRDHTRTLVIADPSCHTDGAVSEDLVVTLFRPTAAQLGPFEPGRPVLFRRLKTTWFGNKIKGQAFGGEGSWAMLCGSRVVPGAGTVLDRPVSQGEVERMNQLAQWANARGQEGVPHVDATGVASPVTPKSKDRTIGQLRDLVFADIEVKILWEQERTAGLSGPQYELYVADGTVNPEPTRNFHNIQATGIPPSAIMCLSLTDAVNAALRPLLTSGRYIRFRNVRCKTHQGSLELVWSEKITEEQRSKGWKDRIFVEIGAHDERAKRIERRLKALRDAGGVGLAQNASDVLGESAPTASSVTPSAPSVAPSPFAPALAQHVRTTHQDPLRHPLTALGDAVANATVPNRYRVRARVHAVLGRGAKGSQPGDLAVLWCAKCRVPFPRNWCESCNDTALARASARYQILVVLEPPDGGGAGAPSAPGASPGAHLDPFGPAPAPAVLLPVLLGGAEADLMLPPLPPVHGGPNEVQRVRRRVRDGVARVHDVLLGAAADGVRPRPVIEWTLESYFVTTPEGAQVAWRVFGMAGTSGPAG